MVKLLLFLTALAVASADVRILRPMPDGRIVGGEDADIKHHPWQLSLQQNGHHICGASILTERWVITAAHCVFKGNAASFSLRAGSNEHASGGAVHNVAEIIIHPKYDNAAVDYDVALLRVDTPFELNKESIRGVGLVKENAFTPAGSLVKVTGWGHLKDGGSASPKLQKVIVPAVSHEDCHNKYSQYGGITDRMMCAGLSEGGKDACQGDSGGPLVNTHDELVGVVSWGAGCALPNKPGVYTNLALPSIRGFISETTGV